MQERALLLWGEGGYHQVLLFQDQHEHPEMFPQGFQERWDQASPEVKEIYGEKFLASSECAVDYGERI